MSALHTTHHHTTHHHNLDNPDHVDNDTTTTTTTTSTTSTTSVPVVPTFTLTAPFTITDNIAPGFIADFINSPFLFALAQGSTLPLP